MKRLITFIVCLTILLSAIYHSSTNSQVAEPNIGGHETSIEIDETAYKSKTKSP